ncbi:plasmid replication initiation protein RepA [Bifidobacterium pseudolongum subsp. globosum]|uniref:Plasmid replication initiation protein RepA n=2 Tax=Bifidobacterium pseudolongum TaxID=1694 RepID=A0A4Q5ACJ1_9BIFI|nr:protein rep [Bifidobacterium pseudolongum]RYQ23576.1 plasmid replication initiation protein RepA [Bifidobacterium pseudolongum subsp. globosum]RYQ25221.1 plasmid replication initiation protein RepA [Bifidobacterium pseudolongum subsp. globosum]
MNLALTSGASEAAPLVNRKVTTQTQSDDQSNSKEADPRIIRRWKIRRLSQRVLCGALPETEWPRIVRCGWSMNALVALLGSKGKTSWSGIEHCNSIWCCPLCSARIREGRRSEIQEGFEASKNLGWKAYFVTFTVPHSISTSLGSSLGGLREAYKKMRRYSSLKSFFSKVEGVITSTEIQVGSSGFHPHRHCIFFTSSEIGEEEVSSLKSAWAKAVVKEGLAKPNESVGVVVKEATTAGISNYLSKVQENKVSLEMTRSDLKQGRVNGKTEWHCSPFDLLDSEVELPISVEQRYKLWLEYYEGSKGVSAIRWSRGLKKKLGVGEVADEELGALSPNEVEAELRWLKEEYRQLFKKQPFALAQAQALFKVGKYEEAQKVAGGELLLNNEPLAKRNATTD